MRYKKCARGSMAYLQVREFDGKNGLAAGLITEATEMVFPRKQAELFLEQAKFMAQGKNGFSSIPL